VTDRTQPGIHNARMPLILFTHANSFPATTYRVLLSSLRARGYTVEAIDQLGHDPRYPVTNNWPHLVQQLADFATEVVARHGEPAYLVGHSLGGFLSLMVAARHPTLAQGVLLLDSPIVGGWRATTLGAFKRAKMVEVVSPGKVSRSRRQHWADAAAALAHFQGKKAFARWEPQVLQDYITFGTHDVGGQRVLGFDRAVETAIYNSFPDNLEGLLRRNPLRCPVAFIGGTQSAEMRQIGMGLTTKITKGRTMMLDGSHLFPMEKPLATAAAIEAALRNMDRT
jgi:pimeloyl-ACP methyl ester carboxylesterase